MYKTVSFVTRILAWRYGGMAQLFEKSSAYLEKAGVTAIRSRLAGDLTGSIIEIGCGTGLNFPHYPPAAEVTAIEPLEEFRIFAAERARSVPARITIQDGDAQALAFEDGSFDTALVTMVLCSVPDANRGLKELRRVLRPGSKARFFEHVRSERSWAAHTQGVLNPCWRYLADGCNLNRNTVEAIRAAGFTIDSVRAHNLRSPGMFLFPMREVHAHV